MSGQTLILGDAFTIERAAELRTQLLAELPGTEQVCLAAISEIDCAGLQLLLALKAEHPTLALINPSAVVSELFRQLNLTHLLSA